MAAHTGVTKFFQTLPIPTVKKISVLALALGFIVALTFTGYAISNSISKVGVGTMDTNFEAWSARYQGMADLFTQQSLVTSQAISASTARWQGMADTASAATRSIAASAERYQEMADAHVFKPLAASAARYEGMAQMAIAPIRSITASGARYQGLATAHVFKPIIASTARWQGMAEDALKVNAAWAARYQGLADLAALDK